MAGTAAVAAAVKVKVESAWSGLPEVTAGVTVVVVLVLEFALVLQLAVMPAGSPVTARLAEVPVAKAPPAVTLIASVVVPPCITVIGDEEEYVLAEDTARVGGAKVTVRGTATLTVEVAALASVARKVKVRVVLLATALMLPFTVTEAVTAEEPFGVTTPVLPVIAPV